MSRSPHLHRQIGKDSSGKDVKSEDSQIFRGGGAGATPKCHPYNVGRGDGFTSHMANMAASAGMGTRLLSYSTDSTSSTRIRISVY